MNGIEHQPISLVLGSAMPMYAKPGATRHSLLVHLQEEIRRQGGSALIALSATAHPVLYVRRTGGRLIPVVVVEDAAANRWFIWGRTGSEHVSRPKQAAAALCGLDRLPPRSWVNPVAARRAAAKGAA